MTISYPNQYRNYCTFSKDVEARANKGEIEFQKVIKELEKPKDESQVLESLYVINLMLDKGLDKNKVSEKYSVLSKFNDTKSPNIQTFLAGIYRKTKVPDAFGPLVKMLIQDSINPPKSNFDPTEEIGGAILDYLA